LLNVHQSSGGLRWNFAGDGMEGDLWNRRTCEHTAAFLSNQILNNSLIRGSLFLRVAEPKFSLDDNSFPPSRELFFPEARQPRVDSVSFAPETQVVQVSKHGSPFV
jgi:hypothetical protein